MEISHRARDDHYKDNVHVDYDLTIRNMAEAEGFAAFSKKFRAESIVHYVPRTADNRSLVVQPQQESGGSHHPVQRNGHVMHGNQTQDAQGVMTNAGSSISVPSKGHKRYKCKE